MSHYKEYEEYSIEVIRQSREDFGEGLYALSSFGAESALLPTLIQKSGVEVPIITIDTGFWLPETHVHRQNLEKRLGFTAISYRPDDLVIDTIFATQLWEKDLSAYRRHTKLNPLSEAINELEVDALLTGIRADQTANRAENAHGFVGRDDEWRIHPVVHWPKQVVKEYFVAEDLPYHPLYHQGYESIDDKPLVQPGKGREGRLLDTKSECGLHIPQAQVA